MTVLRMTAPSLRLALAAVALPAMALTGCDATSAAGGADANVTVQGRVTDDASTARRVPIEGAAVTAASVSTSGQVRALDGEATTSAQGTYTLQTEGTVDAVVVSATKGAFEGSALIEAEGSSRGTVQAPPMTAETAAEAAVYVAARAEGSRARAADAAFFVTSEVAADIEAGRTTAGEVAAALDASLRAEARQAQNDDVDEEEIDEACNERDRSYGTFRTSLNASASASASSQMFVDAYADAYAEAGASAEAQARSAWARALASAQFAQNTSSRTATSVRVQARLMAAVATGHAVEAAFRAQGAGQARITALEAARVQLVASLRTATTDAARSAAEAAYETTVTAALSAETDLSVAQLSAAMTASASARTSLASSLLSAATGEAIASATTSFFADARTAVEGSLGADADLAADVLVLLNAF